MTPQLLEIRQSAIAGLGAFAIRPIRKGTRVIEYAGERITPAEADIRYAGGPAVHPTILLFSVDDHLVIDAGVGGNDARFINHSCEPNCEAVIRRRHVEIVTLRRIKPGEELTYDYNLTGDEEERREQASLYRCHCGAATCRGTMFKIE